MRKLVNKNKVILPSYDRLLKAKEECRPPTITASEDKVTVRLQYLAEHIVNGILKDEDIVVKVNELKEQNGGHLLMYYNFKLGTDGTTSLQVINKKQDGSKELKQGSVVATNFVGLNLWTVFDGKIQILHHNSLLNSAYGVIMMLQWSSKYSKMIQLNLVSDNQ